MNSYPNGWNEFNLHMLAAAAILVKLGIRVDYAIPYFQQSIADAGKAMGLNPTEIGARVGLKKSAIYNYAQKQIAAQAPSDTDLPEKVMNALMKANTPLTASEMASLLEQDDSMVAEMLELLNHNYVQRIEGTNPSKYEIQSDKVSYVHAYPDDADALDGRRGRAAKVVNGSARDKLRSVTLSVRMTDVRVEELYSFIRDYSNPLPSESILNDMVKDTQDRDAIPIESSFQALLLFSPDHGEQDAVQHYENCDDLYCDPRYEMIPYRYPLDEVAIEKFLTNHFDRVIDEISDLLTEHRSTNGGSHSYRMSFICR